MKNLNGPWVKWAIAIVLIIAAFIIGKKMSGNRVENHDGHAHSEIQGEAKTQIWTCSMHPQIKKPGPGKCPICGMDLIPMASDVEESGDGDRELSMSEESRRLARIETQLVEKKVVAKEVRMVGKVDYDESQVKVISTRVAGRIDKLYVDYTGVQIKKGDHLIYLFSPDLYSAQEELIQAGKKLSDFSSEHSKIIHQTAVSTVNAAKERLSQWGLTPSQIAAVESSGKASDHLTVYSPISGVVIHKHAVEGSYVKTGTEIYTIADLSKLWVKLDAYESDIGWLRYGQEVTFTVEAYPGEMFKGRIGFIDPILNPQTRTVKVRVIVENKDLKLKPDMYVTGIAQIKLSPTGQIVDQYLANKWIGPMHPEIVRSKPGKCPICGMDLVKAKSLGYIRGTQSKELPLVIPARAVLITGKRAVVYVELPGKTNPTYEGREVVLGPRVGEYYIVKSGVSEGEMVVSNGAFKIDSELQIRAKPSMMSPEGGVAPQGHQHHDPSSPVKTEGTEMPEAMPKKASSKTPVKLNGLYEAYFQAHKALAGDNLADAQKALSRLGKKAEGLKGRSSFLTDWGIKVRGEVEHAGHVDLGGARKMFGAVSGKMIELSESGQYSLWKTHYRMFCPMAFDGDGGEWLQTERPVANPYFGREMVDCGSLKKTYGKP